MNQTDKGPEGIEIHVNTCNLMPPGLVILRSLAALGTIVFVASPYPKSQIFGSEIPDKTTEPLWLLRVRTVFNTWMKWLTPWHKTLDHFIMVHMPRNDIRSHADISKIILLYKLPLHYSDVRPRSWPWT